MMYPYMTLSDDTEITHSEMHEDGTVEVYIETPDERDGFHNIKCILPQYLWLDNNGYSAAELEYYKELVTNNAHLTITSENSPSSARVEMNHRRD